MPKRRLLWHIFPSYGLLVATAALGFGWAALVILENSFLEATRADLRALADFLDGQLGSDIPRIARRFPAWPIVLPRPAECASRCCFPTAKWTATAAAGPQRGGGVGDAPGGALPARDDPVRAARRAGHPEPAAVHRG
jgi:hypothetical protein